MDYPHVFFDPGPPLSQQLHISSSRLTTIANLTWTLISQEESETLQASFSNHLFIIESVYFILKRDVSAYLRNEDLGLSLSLSNETSCTYNGRRIASTIVFNQTKVKIYATFSNLLP